MGGLDGEDDGGVFLDYITSKALGGGLKLYCIYVLHREM